MSEHKKSNRPRQVSQIKYTPGILNHKQVFEVLGYVPGVCWSCLKQSDSVVSFRLGIISWVYIAIISWVYIPVSPEAPLGWFDAS